VQDHPVTKTAGLDVESLYRENRDRLWRAVYLWCGDREVATDAVAEAFAQALRRGSAIRAMLPWVWKAAFRIAAAELKRRSAPVGQAARPAPADTPIGTSVLEEVLARLPARQRAAIVLHYYAGYSLKEVADVLGTTVPAVGMRLTRARRRLRQLLEERDD
jgi:RNA polymerase sigma-70 factor, ECF subfamily